MWNQDALRESRHQFIGPAILSQFITCGSGAHSQDDVNMEKGEDEGAALWHLSQHIWAVLQGGDLGWLFDRIGLGREIPDSSDITNGSLELVETPVRCLV